VTATVSVIIDSSCREVADPEELLDHLEAVAAHDLASAFRQAVAASSQEVAAFHQAVVLHALEVAFLYMNKNIILWRDKLNNCKLTWTQYCDGTIVLTKI